MKLSNLTKKQTGIIFIFVYILTIILGYFIYQLFSDLTYKPILSMLIADVVMTLVIFIIGTFLKNASLYDPYWSVIPLFLIVFWELDVAMPFNFSTIMMFVVLLLWGVRLTYNWWKNWTGFDEQDWRYDLLREKNKKIYPITNLFGIHMIPTVVVFLQMINVFGAVGKDINLISVIGYIFCIIAPIIQFYSDKQMFDFRKNNKEKNKIIDTGLWKYSRHPNYFGELLFWVGIYIVYYGTAETIDINMIYPILMILLFVFISVPMMENKLKDRDGFEEYRKNVSMLIPFFRKKDDV